MDRQKRCEWCKKYFYTTRSDRKYCSPNCCREADRLRQRKLYARKRGKASISPRKNRELTSDTAYLCQKWYREEMSIKEIALCLDRSVTSVERALKAPLSAMQKEKMEVFLMPRRRKV